MTKKKIAPWLTAIPVLLLIAMIFSFSAETAEVSGETSGKIVDFLLSVFVADYDTLSAEARLTLREGLQHVVRKLAHFTEFALLGFTALLHIRVINGAEALRFAYPGDGWLGWFFGTAVAALDETHQLFVAGRAGSPKDVLLDSAGVLFGTLLLAACHALLRHFRGRRAKP